jgi:hypothetical protein
LTTAYDAILEDFVADLEVVQQTVDIVATSGAGPKTRVAAANASTLLLAATFEEFVRQLATEYARSVIARAQQIMDLPKELFTSVWKRSMDRLARHRISDLDSVGLVQFLQGSSDRFNSVLNFYSGDLTQDIYDGVIHNENNLRTQYLNALFKVSGLSDICGLASAQAKLKEYFGEQDSGVTRGMFTRKLDEFIDRRNEITHSLRTGVSSSPEQLKEDIQILLAFAHDAVAVLELQRGS